MFWELMWNLDKSRKNPNEKAYTKKVAPKRLTRALQIATVGIKSMDLRTQRRCPNRVDLKRCWKKQYVEFTSSYKVGICAADRGTRALREGWCQIPGRRGLASRAAVSAALLPGAAGLG